MSSQEELLEEVGGGDGRAEGSLVKETKVKLQCHSHLMLTERMLPSLKVRNLMVVSTGLTIFGHLFSPSHSRGGYFCRLLPTLYMA